MWTLAHTQKEHMYDICIKCIWQKITIKGWYAIKKLKIIAQSAGAVEYIDFIFAEEKDSPKKCPGYDAKQPGGETPVMPEFGVLGNAMCSFIAIAPCSPLNRSGSTC